MIATPKPKTRHEKTDTLAPFYGAFGLPLAGKAQYNKSSTPTTSSTDKTILYELERNELITPAYFGLSINPVMSILAPSTCNIGGDWNSLYLAQSPRASPAGYHIAYLDNLTGNDNKGRALWRLGYLRHACQLQKNIPFRPAY